MYGIKNITTGFWSPDLFLGGWLKDYELMVGGLGWGQLHPDFSGPSTSSFQIFIRYIHLTNNVWTYLKPTTSLQKRMFVPITISPFLPDMTYTWLVHASGHFPMLPAYSIWEFFKCNWNSTPEDTPVELRWRNIVMLVQPFPSSMKGMNSSTLGEKVENDTRVP